MVLLLRTCANDIFPGDSQNLAVCLLAKSGDPKAALTTCGAHCPPNAEEVAETVACIQGAGKDPNRLSECLVRNRPNYKAAVETTLCVSQSGGDSSKLAACAAARVGGTAGAVAQCLASQPAGTRDPVKCAAAADPRLATAQKVYNCAQKAGDVQSALVACSDGVLDQKTQQAVTCVAKRMATGRFGRVRRAGYTSGRRRTPGGLRRVESGRGVIRRLRRGAKRQRGVAHRGGMRRLNRRRADFLCELHRRPAHYPRTDQMHRRQNRGRLFWPEQHNPKILEHVQRSDPRSQFEQRDR